MMVLFKCKPQDDSPVLAAKNRLPLLGLLLLPLLLSGCGGGGSDSGTSLPGAPLNATLPAIPVAPTGLTATSGNGEVAISWNPVNGAASYNIYYLTYPGVTTTNSRQLTSVVSGDPITGLTNTVPYYFVVTAVNSVGESLASSEISATPMPALPGIPGNVRLAPGLGEATLKWQAVPYATSYNVYYGTSPGLTTASPLSIKGIHLTEQKITGLNVAPGHYYFMVTAVDASGEGAPSVELPAIAKPAYKALAAGFGHSAALRIIEPEYSELDGTVWMWGDNSSGQLGDQTIIPKLTAQIVPTLSYATQIRAGYHHTLTLQTDNSISGFGLNNKGQIGDNGASLLANYKFPQKAFAPPAMTEVSGGYLHTVALKNDGTVWTWGYNNFGQLGYASINCENPGNFNQPLAWSCSFTPTQVTGITASIVAVAAGFQHTLAVASDGTVWSWGRNDTGQLGSSVPNCPLSLMTGTLAGDFGFTAGWATPNTDYSCSTIPVQVNAIPGTITAVAAGTRHSVALMSDGTVWTWGGNRLGQLGYTPLIPDCTITNLFKMACSNTPQKVQGIDHVIAIAAGSDHTLALRNDGTVWIWGYQGGGTITAPIYPPVQQTPGSVQPVTVTDPDLTAVFYAAYQTPTQVPGLDNITAIAAGAYHSLALRNDGTAWAWGDNSQGQLGNNSRTKSNTPVKVQGLLGPVIIIPGL